MDWKRFLFANRWLIYIISLWMTFSMVDGILFRCQKRRTADLWWTFQFESSSSYENWEIQICQGFGSLRAGIERGYLRLETGFYIWMTKAGLIEHFEANSFNAGICRLGGRLVSIPAEAINIILTTTAEDVLEMTGHGRHPNTDTELGPLVEVLFHCFCAAVLEFFIWVGYNWWNKKQQRSWTFKSSLCQEIARKYTARKLIKSNDNFHHFQMVTKISGQEVFVKCRRAAASLTARLAFARESRALKALQHPGIVDMTDWMRVGVRSCMVLDFAGHGNLKIAIEKGLAPCQFSDKVSVYRQIVDVVRWLHEERRWAHLNLRPVNVLMLEPWSRVKITGFTRAIEAKPGNSCSMYDLHPACVPPEVKDRVPYNPYSVDQWQLGGLLFFILTGYPAEQEATILLNRAISLVDPQSSNRDGLSLSRLVSDLLSSEPELRPSLSRIIDSLHTPDNDIAPSHGMDRIDALDSFPIHGLEAGPSTPYRLGSSKPTIK